MILELQERICCGASGRIQQAIAAIDAQASVSVNAVAGSVAVEGLLSQEQVIAALALAGFHAAPAHASGGSECCGSCT